jgi:hypothetical protein
MLAVPTQHPAVLFTVVTLVFWLSALVSGSPFVTAGRISSRTLWALVAVVPVIVASIQLKSATRELRVPVRAERVAFLYAYGFTATDRNAFWMGRHAIGVVDKEQPFFSWTAEGPHLTEPVRVRLWRNQQLIADLEVSRDRPVTRIMAVPSRARMFSLEAAVTGSLPGDRVLRITPQWLPGVPPGTPSEQIVPE